MHDRNIDPFPPEAYVPPVPSEVERVIDGHITRTLSQQIDLSRTTRIDGGAIQGDRVTIGSTEAWGFTAGTIIVNRLQGPVLMSRDNPHGWALEALAEQLIREMEAKTANIAEDKREHAQAVVWRNRAILGHLGEIRRLVRENVSHLAAYAPDPGPTGTPRIGVGSEGYATAETIHHPV